MAYSVKILPEAKADIHEAAIWYNRKSDGLGKRFIRSLKNEVAIITRNPLIYEIRYDDIRIAIPQTFPYLIHFAIYNNIIIIKAIFHSSRDSQIWLEKN